MQELSLEEEREARKGKREDRAWIFKGYLEMCYLANRGFSSGVPGPVSWIRNNLGGDGVSAVDI